MHKAIWQVCKCKSEGAKLQPALPAAAAALSRSPGQTQREKRDKAEKRKGKVQTFAGTLNPIYSSQLFTQWGHFLQDGGEAICATRNLTSILSFIWKNVLFCCSYLGTAKWAPFTRGGGNGRRNSTEGWLRLYDQRVITSIGFLGLITKVCVVYITKKSWPWNDDVTFTVLYIPLREEWAFFTGRSTSLLNGFCRFLPVSSPYPWVRQTQMPATVSFKWSTQTKTFIAFRSFCCQTQIAATSWFTIYCLCASEQLLRHLRHVFLSQRLEKKNKRKKDISEHRVRACVKSLESRQEWRKNFLIPVTAHRPRRLKMETCSRLSPTPASHSTFVRNASISLPASHAVSKLHGWFQGVFGWMFKKQRG